jgi:hypothetical protein
MCAEASKALFVSFSRFFNFYFLFSSSFLCRLPGRPLFTRVTDCRKSDGSADRLSIGPPTDNETEIKVEQISASKWRKDWRAPGHAKPVSCPRRSASSSFRQFVMGCGDAKKNGTPLAVIRILYIESSNPSKLLAELGLAVPVLRLRECNQSMSNISTRWIASRFDLLDLCRLFERQS